MLFFIFFSFILMASLGASLDNKKVQGEVCTLVGIAGQASSVHIHNLLDIHSDDISTCGENACFRWCLI